MTVSSFLTLFVLNLPAVGAMVRAISYGNARALFP